MKTFHVDTAAEAFDVLRSMTITEPKRIARLPRWGNYPVPFFVTWYLEGEKVRPGLPGAKPDFRVMSDHAWSVCMGHRRCWICGDVLGGMAVFVAGPLSILQRGGVEPPSHRDCAEYAVRVCPYMVERREERRTNVPPNTETDHSLMADYNPGVAATYVTKTWKPTREGSRIVFVLGEPLSVSWWREGRPATRREVLNGMEFGLPQLIEVRGVGEVDRLFDAFLPLLPP